MHHVFAKCRSQKVERAPEISDWEYLTLHSLGKNLVNYVARAWKWTFVRILSSGEVSRSFPLLWTSFPCQDKFSPWYFIEFDLRFQNRPVKQAYKNVGRFPLANVAEIRPTIANKKGKWNTMTSWMLNLLHHDQRSCSSANIWGITALLSLSCNKG